MSKHCTSQCFSSCEVVAALWSMYISRLRCHHCHPILYYFYLPRRMLVSFKKDITSLLNSSLHRPTNSSQSHSFTLPPLPNWTQRVRSYCSSFSLMLMHILSLLHTNVSWPRLTVCLSLDLHLLSGYWPQFNLTLVSANPGPQLHFSLTSTIY